MGKAKKEVWEQDECVFEFLRRHKGESNKVTQKQIARHLRDNGFVLNDLSVSAIVGRIMEERNAPICSAGRGGYWWAASREDIDTAIADAESRIAAYKERIKFYESFILD